jgi:hypothetical protein
MSLGVRGEITVLIKDLFNLIDDLFFRVVIFTIFGDN